MNLISISGKIGSGKDEAACIIMENTPQKWKVKKWADMVKKTVALWTGCSVYDLEDREFKEKVIGPDWVVYYKVATIMHYVSTAKEKISGPIFTSEEEAQKSWLSAPVNYDKLGEEVIMEPLTYRKLLQLVGTEAGRKLIHPNIWVISTLKSFKEGENWIITDTRFPNEFWGAQEKAKKENSRHLSIRIDRTLENRTNGKFKTLKEVQSKDLKLYEKLTHESETSLDDDVTLNKGIEFDYYIDNNGSLEEFKQRIKQLIRWQKLNEQ